MGKLHELAGRGKSGIHIKESRQGLLHRNLGISENKPIPASRLQAAKNSDDPKIRRRAVFALNARKWHH